MFVINIGIGFNWTLNSFADEYSQRNVFHILKKLINEERRLDWVVYVVMEAISCNRIRSFFIKVTSKWPLIICRITTQLCF